MKFTARKFKVTAVIFTLALLQGLSLSTGAVSAAGSARSGDLHVTKECSLYAGSAGSFCTITSSNIAEIKVGSRVYYGQAANVFPGFLDSPVVLDARNGDRAVGRCTLDFVTGLGLCSFSDGTGRFNYFEARVEVSPIGTDGINWRWDGVYSFNPGPR